MKRLVLLTVLVFAVTTAPAEAFNADRTIETDCINGKIHTKLWGTILGRMTSVSCWHYMRWDGSKYAELPRPWSDMEGALRSARVWYPRCEPQGFAGTWEADQVHFLTWFHVCA